MEDSKKEPKSKQSETVALVNNEKIIQSELDSYAHQIAVIQKISLPEKGTEERKKFEDQALDQIINNILLFQDADKQGINISKEELDSQYLIITEQVGGEEKLDEILKKTGMTKEHLRNDLERQNVIEKYFDFVKEKNEITVSSEEIKSFYDEQVVPKNPGIELEKVEGQIRQKLERQKLLQPISEILKNLRQEAEIKLL